ncbi:hypothetical protein N7465_002504 [Penicillium sp. CMV-2018d]|nr:hypothetical protein N7465_002504 [Penicillium sp. CMV-2018d]
MSNEQSLEPPEYPFYHPSERLCLMWMARSRPIGPSNVYRGALLGGYQSVLTLALAYQGDFWIIGMFINVAGSAHFGMFTALRRSHVAILQTTLPTYSALTTVFFRIPLTVF